MEWLTNKQIFKIARVDFEEAIFFIQGGKVDPRDENCKSGIADHLPP